MKSNEVNEYVGLAFEDLTEENMSAVQGAGDVDPEMGWSMILSNIYGTLTVSYDLATYTVCRPH